MLEAKKLRELGPEGSPVVNDIRAVLLEVASQPPRLRQDQALFHKEIARFQTSLDPLPDWLLNAMKWSDEGRLNRAIAWACVLKLARVSLEANPIRLHLDREGEEWLSAGAPEDSLKIFDFLRSFELRDAVVLTAPGIVRARPYTRVNSQAHATCFISERTSRPFNRERTKAGTLLARRT